MPSAFVLRVQQELRELVDGAVGTSHVAGDGCGDPVTVLGRALVVRAQDDAPAVGAQPAVAPRRLAAGEIAKQSQVSRSRRQPVKAQSLARVNWTSG
ncbi:hypothetical protein ACIQJT_35200 [Streptomyces sp. NPDC091972]|uniref:hypothetical protein n=1 Tax=Streptomyces sp. NPDC091972 TaxID=3366007 RepID=UPI003813A1D4